VKKSEKNGEKSPKKSFFKKKNFLVVTHKFPQFFVGFISKIVCCLCNVIFCKKSTCRHEFKIPQFFVGTISKIVCCLCNVIFCQKKCMSTRSVFPTIFCGNLCHRFSVMFLTCNFLSKKSACRHERFLHHFQTLQL